MRFPQACPVKDEADLAQARQLAAAIGKALDFDESTGTDVVSVATELASNLVKHTQGQGGELVFSPIALASGWGLDILAIDRGPGFGALGKGLAAANSPNYAHRAESAAEPEAQLGVGLNRVRRLSSEFDVYSEAGQGSVVFSRRWPSAAHLLPAVPAALQVGALCLPPVGEAVCGDAWAMHSRPEAVLFVLADGAGQGPDAAQAANRAVCLFNQYAPSRPATLLSAIHTGLHPLANAAVAVVELSLAHHRISYAGLGAIAGRLLCGEASLELVSGFGTAGYAAPNIQPYSYDWPADEGLLVLHSDGLVSHWNLADYPGLAAKHAAVIAGVLYRDFRRAQDDCTVVVVKLINTPATGGE